MNVNFTLHGIHFEWNDEKASVNISKHGISFESACEVLFDPLVVAVDEEIVQDELREHVIGMTVNWRLLYVIYVERGNAFRLISARRVEPHERRYYENQ